MEPESSLPYSRAPATCPYPEPTPSSPHNPFPLPEVDISSKNPQTSNFMKTHAVGAELFHEDGQTDMTKLIGAFRKNCEKRLTMTCHNVTATVVGRG